MNKRNFEMIEGSPGTKMRQLIRRFGHNEYDRFELATVTSITPTTIKLDNDPLTLDAFDLVFAEHLTTYKRMVKKQGSDIETEMTFLSPLTVGDRVIIVKTNDGQTYLFLDRAVSM